MKGAAAKERLLKVLQGWDANLTNMIQMTQPEAFLEHGVWHRHVTYTELKSFDSF